MRAALLFTLVSAVSWADSPLTSISFATAYSDVPAIGASREKQLAFLTQQGVPNDQKLAVATAMQWGSDNARVFVQLLEKLRPGDVTASDRFVAGYLLARDDYMKLTAKGLEGRTALQLLDAACDSLRDDFAVHYARALVKAHAQMTGSWCEVFRGPEAVKKQFPEAKRNLRPGALEAADGYLKLYADECPGSKEAKQKATSELNQIYSVMKLGSQLVTGTQGGVAVWEPSKSQKPVATRPGFICRGLVWGGPEGERPRSSATPEAAREGAASPTRSSAWLGCEKEVVRWDGKAFKSYLPRSGKNSGDYYQPMVGPKGVLWVRLAAKLWFYDSSTDRFQQLSAPWKKDPYDALARANGETWWVDFLHELVVDGRPVALRSQTYPGRDPRRFREDASGTLWLEDFESGLFRYDDSFKVFVKQPGIDAKASGVARDKSGRLLMLHYTDGLVVSDGSKVNLRECDVMRDMLLDDNGDVWVGGHTGLMRLRADGPTWGKQLFTVE